MALIADLRRDYFILGYAASPGVCEFIGANDGRKWDEQAGYGFSGASLAGGGRKLSHFGAKLTIFEQPDDVPPSGQWTSWQTFKPLLAKPAFNVRDPSIGIEHPILTDLGISAVVFEDRTQWSQDEFGLWTMQIKLIEYRGAPQVSFARVSPGVPAGPAQPPTAQTAHAAAVQAARDEMDAAAAGGGAAPGHRRIITPGG